MKKRKRKDPMTIPNLSHEQRLALADLLNNKDVDVLRPLCLYFVRPFARI